jgi:transposase
MGWRPGWPSGSDGTAAMVRQELEREHGIGVSLRTVERAVQELRRELVAEAGATVRFETAPGRQLQIDFGSTFVTIADEPVRVFLFVATLGYSARYWGFRPQACAPYRARTKGKDERGVGYVNTKRHRRPPFRLLGRA